MPTPIFDLAMDEHSGRGWWQASDGRWYPPEQHPDPAHRGRYAAPAPAAGLAPVTGPKVLPPRPVRTSTTKRIVSGAAAVAAVLAVGVGAFLAAGGASDENGGGGTSPSTTTTPTPDDDEDEGESGDGLVTVDVLDLAFDLPERWVTVAPGSGVDAADVGLDGEVGEGFDARLSALPPEIILFGIDGEDGSGFLTVSAPELGPVGGIAGAVASLEQFVTGAGAEILINEEMTLAGQPGRHVRYERTVGAIQEETSTYFIGSDEHAFVVALTTVDGDELEEFDATSQTFRLQ